MFPTFFSFIIVILIYTIYRSFVFWDVNMYIYICRYKILKKKSVLEDKFREEKFYKFFFF